MSFAASLRCFILVKFGRGEDMIISKEPGGNDYEWGLFATTTTMNGN